ncbi:MAG: HDOD domain-containing protein [Proteobacteria bacterium]|nr:HDOD domain-containing protein [Pseudomonadota bacterium]
MSGFDHAMLTGMMLDSWNLPDTLVDTVYWHHEPQRARRAGAEAAILKGRRRGRELLRYRQLFRAHSARTAGRRVAARQPRPRYRLQRRRADGRSRPAVHRGDLPDRCVIVGQTSV